MKSCSAPGCLGVPLPILPCASLCWVVVVEDSSDVAVTVMGGTGYAGWVPGDK